jgi:hypothetical protein
LAALFPKKIENQAAAVAPDMMRHNFVCIHQTLRITPAMGAGVTDHVWGILAIVALLEASERGSEGAS